VIDKPRQSFLVVEYGRPVSMRGRDALAIQNKKMEIPETFK
jgi:hypothetical protein